MWFRSKAARRGAVKPKQEYEALLKDTLPDLRPLIDATRPGPESVVHKASLKKVTQGTARTSSWLLTKSSEKVDELMRAGEAQADHKSDPLRA